MTKSLFDTFNSVNAKAWKQKIQFDLKGADYNETLLWKSPEGIHVKPFYNEEDLENLNLETTPVSNWFIGQDVYCEHTNKSNEFAINAIARGAEAVRFTLPNTSIDLTELLKGIDTNKTVILLNPLFLSTDYVTKNKEIITSANIVWLGGPIDQLLSDGNWFSSLKNDIDSYKTIINTTKSLSIDASIFSNAGASIVQQLAYVSGIFTEYLNYYGEALNNTILYIHLAVGTNYFFEISKCRALRLLINSITEEFNINITTKILVTPTKRNKTIYDYNTNLLRTTTECMSAVLGGADYIFNTPYDAIYKKTHEFSDRISRNQLLVLKHESYFNTVSNPSDGAYYIESLTHQIAQESLDLFKQTENSGGFLALVKEGIIQKKIKENANKEQEAFNNKTTSLLGTNLFPNPNDKMKGDLELYPFLKQNPRKTIIEPIISRRLAEAYEQDRLNNEKQ